MTLYAKQKCPDGQHLMSGTECIRCGQFVSPLRTHPEAQGNKDLGEPPLTRLEVRNAAIEACAAVVDREAAYWESERIKSIDDTLYLREKKGTEYLTHEAYWAHPLISEQGHIHRARDVLQNAAGLIRLLKTSSSERSEAAPTSPQPIKGESRFTAACKAADAILAPMTAEFGRILEEAPTQPVTVSICSYSVEIPAKKFMDLYDATDRTESELESASNGMGLR